jgi:hypothetical protein
LSSINFRWRKSTHSYAEHPVRPQLVVRAKKPPSTLKPGAPFVSMGAIVIELSDAVKLKINDFVVRISVYPGGAVSAAFSPLHFPT